MSAPTNQAAPQNDPGHRAAGAHDYAEVLHELITMGTDLARLLHEQATAQAQAAQQDPRPQPAPAPAPCAPVPDALAATVAAFNCAVRAVRRGVMLARILAEPLPPVPDPARHRAAARKRILREVEDTIQRPGSDGRGGPALPADLQDSLCAELRDRLDGPDLDDDIASRPIADVITEIRRDLGLDAHPGTRPFARRTPDDIRQLYARAAAPSAARQPSIEPQFGPQDPRRGAAKRAPDPHPDNPTDAPRTRPVPTDAARDLPEDPAEAIAIILRYHAQAQRHPPPAG